MTLEMKTSCGQCQVSLDLAGIAYICSYECTFCETCSQGLSLVCPNCGGELVIRPCRKDS